MMKRIVAGLIVAMVIVGATAAGSLTMTNSSELVGLSAPMTAIADPPSGFLETEKGRRVGGLLVVVLSQGALD